METMKPSTIAIIGMAGRFPGARNVRELWRNLRDGVESIRSLSDAELLAAGVTPAELARPEYVKRAALLDDVPYFDAPFFGLSPRDAAIMDPQHRHFLECAWEALEDASHPPKSFAGSIGVFAGSGMNAYLIHNLLANRQLLDSAGLFQLKQTGNDKDVLATRVSYQFDLRGPSVSVQTACSTSLVAVHLACQSLLNHECDMALAGGVTIEIPHGHGYLYREGEILARDGYCRPFDAAATGTVFSSGVGLVVLRRLEDALADRDAIRAVILGSAINNDGARKVSYLAPSVEGQAEVIAEALEFAGVSADEISYVEAHGTGTLVGDPIEVRALAQAFRKSTTRSGYCAIGSLKSNVGHLDAAAGVAALIKTVLSIEHAQLPASLHFNHPNPRIELDGSPFFVNSTLSDWPESAQPRRAGVTSLGIGGTNAHVVLEQAPRPVVTHSAKPCYLMTVSAKTASSADRAAANLAAYLDVHPGLSLADAAFTCHVGRQAFSHRRAFVARDSQVVLDVSVAETAPHFVAGIAADSAPDVVFMFPGQGSQHINMGRELYENEKVFRDTLDLCAQHLRAQLGIDLCTALYPADSDANQAAKDLNQTWLTQPALFAVEYALAQWWISLGVEPAAMVGHSIGEYVAACIAGAFSLEDALAIAAFRGRLMFGLSAGAMLAVSLPASDLHLSGGLSLAAINGPGLCVLSGPTAEIVTLEQDLAMQSVACRRIATSHAFHSAMMDPILAEFEEKLRSFQLQPPRIPYLSNLTGTWIKPEEATDPAYWARHLRQTVRFSDCLSELRRKDGQIFLEVGPGTVLTSLAREQRGASANAFPSLPHPHDREGALYCALRAVGQLWTLAVHVDWSKLYDGKSPHRVSLPTYAFDHERYWIEADSTQPAPSPAPAQHTAEHSDLSLYRRIWTPAPLKAATANSSGCWLLFNDGLGLADQIAARLRAQQRDVILVDSGPEYLQISEQDYTLRSGVRTDYDALIADIFKSGRSIDRIVHLWSVAPSDTSIALEETIARSFLSPLFLVQALTGQGARRLELVFVSNCLQQVFAEEVLNPERAVLFGPAGVVPVELPEITCRSIDIDFEIGSAGESADQVLAEMLAGSNESAVAYRRGKRFGQSVERINLAAAAEHARLAVGGAYLITGGLGGLGLAVAEHLAQEFKARLILVGRSTLPPEENWEASSRDARLSDVERQRILKLIDIRAASGGLLVAHGDVTSLEQMCAIVAQSKEKFGTIDGVFHAAGVLDDGPLMLKTAASVNRVLAPKIHGTLVLEEALRGAPLECFVLFSSVSSVLPVAGQLDYAAGNAFLDAFALSRKGPVIAINWDAWRDVGMAARSSTLHPMLDTRTRNTPDETVYASRFSSERMWMLAEHTLNVGGERKALLPGTGYLEMAAAAITRGTGVGAVEFRDVYFLTPLLVDNGLSKEVRLQLKPEEGAPRGAQRFSVFSQSGVWIEHSMGIVSQIHAQPLDLVDRAATLARCQEKEIIFDERHRTRQERQLDFGPRWRSLRRVLLGHGEGVAEIELDEQFSGDLSSFRLHPALLDLATGAALYLIPGYQDSGDLFLPISYERAQFFQPLPARFRSHMRLRRQGHALAEIAVFDITLFDEQDQVLAEIEGFAMRRITDPVGTLLHNLSATGDVRAKSDGMFEDPTAGIATHDGVRALTTILMTRTPNSVIVTSRELQELTPGTAPKYATAPPSPAVAPPSDDVVGTLTLWWSELLGVNRIEPQDDFFLLGGHSLVGVRLLARIKKTYRVDLQLADLFESRTVQRIANAIGSARNLSTAK